MDVLHARCAGLDVHKDTVVACARVVVDGRVEQAVVTFGTTTTDLLALGDWLTAHRCGVHRSGSGAAHTCNH